MKYPDSSWKGSQARVDPTAGGVGEGGAASPAWQGEEHPRGPGLESSAAVAAV